MYRKKKKRKEKKRKGKEKKGWNDHTRLGVGAPKLSLTKMGYMRREEHQPLLLITQE